MGMSSACLGVNRIKKNFCKSKSILQCACGVTVRKLNMAIGYTDRSFAASARAELKRFSLTLPLLLNLRGAIAVPPNGKRLREPLNHPTLSTLSYHHPTLYSYLIEVIEH
jgi:hypothetical protein